MILIKGKTGLLIESILIGLSLFLVLSKIHHISIISDKEVVGERLLSQTIHFLILGLCFTTGVLEIRDKIKALKTANILLILISAYYLYQSIIMILINLQNYQAGKSFFGVDNILYSNKFGLMTDGILRILPLFVFFICIIILNRIRIKRRITS